MKLPFSVVVDTPVKRLETVLYAKPLTVAFDPPVAVMVPLSIAVVPAIDEALCVVTVGIQALVVKDAEMAPNEVPPEFVA
jgi:hypothetical protein